MSVITALRSLGTTPGPVLAAVLTLALAAGVNLAMFGLIDRALLSAPAGVADADRLFTLGFQPPGDPASAGRMTTTSYVMFTEIRDGVPSLSAAAFQRLATTGARPSTVLALVLREASVIAMLGAVIGCTAAVSAGRWLESLLYGTKATDPLVLGAAASVMLLVALLATLRPARSASKSDPSVLLRSQ